MGEVDVDIGTNMWIIRALLWIKEKMKITLLYTSSKGRIPWHAKAQYLGLSTFAENC
jgi:hypothetical protein